MKSVSRVFLLSLLLASLLLSSLPLAAQSTDPLTIDDFETALWVGADADGAGIGMVA